MTTTVVAEARPGEGTPSGPGRLRTAVAVVGIAAALPYLVLKVLWLTGHPAGISDASVLDDLWLANLLTLGMDAVSVLLSLAFVRPWGRRVRAGWLTFPMWVGTGLLGTILVALPIYLLSLLVAGPDPAATSDADDPIRMADWVFPMVYGGFTVQGLALITGFLLYARKRWADLLASRIGALPDSPTLPVQRALAAVAAVLALGVAAAHLYWLAGGTAGLPVGWVAERSRGIAVMDGVAAVMAVAGAAALLVLVLRLLPDRRVRVPLAVVWTAVGSLFGWGSWQLVAHGMTITVTELDRAVPGLLTLVEAVQVVVGLLVLAVGAFALTERAAAASRRPTVESAE